MLCNSCGKYATNSMILFNEKNSTISIFCFVAKKLKLFLYLALSFKLGKLCLIYSYKSTKI